MKTAKLLLSVEYDETKTDAEAVATALDRLLETAMSTPDILSEYGPVDVGEFLIDDPDSQTMLV